MSTVGQGFGAFGPNSRMAPSAPKNPLDKSTIISIVPFTIIETKPTLRPNTWIIEKPKDGDFTTLVVEAASWWKYLGENQPFLEISKSSIEISQSIITDYCNGFIGCNMNDRMPGLFFVPGEFTKITIHKYASPEGVTFKQLMDVAKTKQESWFKEIVQMSDVDWSRTNGNPLAISEIARLAAQYLKLQKPWMQDFQAFQLDACPACGQLTNLKYPVCKHCKAIVNPERAKELNLQFAK